MTDRPGPLTEERRKTHGDWATTARITRLLKDVVAGELEARGIRGQSAHLSAGQREALDMIMAKIARILSGDPNHTDHWLDVSGYGLLGAKDGVE